MPNTYFAMSDFFCFDGFLGAPHRETPRPEKPYKIINVNKEKGAVAVKWNDNTVSVVRCQDGEPFDLEKGIALCFMKHMYDNRSCYNEVFKEVRKNMEEE